MRFVSYQHEGSRYVGVHEGSEVVPLIGISEISPDTPAEALTRAERDVTAAVPFESVQLLPAVPNPTKVICVGVNYEKHKIESKRTDVDYPVLFAKYAASLLGARDEIVRPRAEFVDYEAELAIVIGKRGRWIAEADAWDHVLGSTLANDITARDYQYKTHQWLQGKAWDRSTPVGPEIVTVDEFMPVSGSIRCIVNGSVEQDADLSDLIFSIPVLIATISEFTELLPGDLILTGTPGGVGYRREPQLNLQTGDEVTVEIEGIGTMTNTLR